MDCHFDSPLVLTGVMERGRFGSSLAVLPDLNSDNLADLAVGAPLENGGKGSIYIFHGSGFGQINPAFSQVSKTMVYTRLVSSARHCTWLLL